jgi:predicted peroxiredoxin
MAKLLVTAAYGYDNSTRAAMPFYVAKGAREAGIDVGIVLALDATVLVKPELRKRVQPYGQPALEELFQFAPWERST